MQFMAVMRRLTETFSQDEFDKYLEAEAEAVRNMYIEGTIRAIWSRGDSLGAVLLLEADSSDHAKQLIASLPLMRQNMLDFEKLIPLRGYRGFGPRG
jgi:muconolactone delta-isomerase